MVSRSGSHSSISSQHSHRARTKENNKKMSCSGSIPGCTKNKQYRAGKLTRNPFLNFLRDYRQKTIGKSILEISRAGAACWRNMDKCEKEPYVKQASAVPKVAIKRRRRCSRCGRKRRSRSRSCGRSRKRSSRSKRRKRKRRYPCDYI